MSVGLHFHTIHHRYSLNINIPHTISTWLWCREFFFMGLCMCGYFFPLAAHQAARVRAPYEGEKFKLQETKVL